MNFQNNFRKSKISKHCLADTIEICRHCHRTLCELVYNLNEIFKLHLLTALGGTFLFILFNIYFSLYGYYIIDDLTDKYKKFRSNLRILFWWNMIYTLRFIVTTGFAHITAYQVNMLDKIKYQIASICEHYRIGN